MLLPKHGRVAIILRGQAFREPHRGTEGCDRRFRERQRQATLSLKEKIISPLENCSKGYCNTVETFLIEGSNCSLVNELGTNLKRTPVVKKTFRSRGQGDGMQRALDEFRLHVKDPKSYRLVIITRPDIIWKMSIEDWPTVDFGGFNFFSPCEKNTEVPPRCVNDILHIMPGEYFDAFDDIVGPGIASALPGNASIGNASIASAPECFNRKRASGHGCYTAVAQKFGIRNVHFVTDYIHGSTRESNRIIEFRKDTENLNGFTMDNDFVQF